MKDGYLLVPLYQFIIYNTFTAKQLHDMRPLSRHWPLKSEVRDLVRRQGCARRGCRAGTRAPKRAVTSVYNQDAHGTESAAGNRSRVMRTVERTALDSDRLTSASPSASSLYVLNAASLAKPHAVEQLAVELRSCNIDVAILSESHFKTKHTDSAVSIPGYTLLLLRVKSNIQCSSGCKISS